MDEELLVSLVENTKWNLVKDVVIKDVFEKNMTIKEAMKDSKKFKEAFEKEFLDAFKSEE